tara:strand:- start:137 stop:1666 length:1530 start_codon:yes stop_codon:yes gene_type:complete
MANLGNQKIKDTYQLVLQTDASGNLQKLDGSTPNPFIVNGNLRYVDGTQNNGYVLLSDASGNASWGPVAFSGDVYISGGSINGTTIELQASSGGTVSVPGLSWSSSTSGHISNSGLTGNVGIGTATPNEKLTVVGDISGTTDLHIGRNITTTNNLTVNIDTLYGDSATGNVGVGNLRPTHKLTISGNTFPSVILPVGQSIVLSEGDVRMRFDGGATNTALYVGQQLKIVDGGGVTQTVTIASFASITTLYLTYPFPSDVVTTSYLYSTSNNTNQFAVYSGTNIAFQVSGDVVMSGSTDLLDIFASSGITNQDVYWSANTNGTSISPSGGTTDVLVGGNIVSDNEEYFSTTGRLVVLDNTTNYYGPNNQGVNYYYWNRDLGTNPLLITSKTNNLNSGFKLPYKAILTGYHLNIQGRGADGDDNIEFTLVYCDGMWDGDVTSTSQDLVAAEIGQTITITTANNFYVLDRRDQFSIEVGAMTMLYPRFKKTSTASGTINYDFQLAIQYRRVI